ncbi:MAG: 30S ribosomal protein S8 [Gammaproteobacteria bacterium]|jgi:small subunit ribosomal protein S8|nr:30S ribosomal protein S8 [Gammaproteobacteria bacterium]
MGMSDPLSDMLTRIRNGQQAYKSEVTMPSSKLKLAVAEVLRDEGYIRGFETTEESGKPMLKVALKYYLGRPVIENLKRVSRPGLRIYRSKQDVPTVIGGLGVAVVSTSKGLMTDKAARAAGIGGEVLCIVE